MRCEGKNLTPYDMARTSTSSGIKTAKRTSTVERKPRNWKDRRTFLEAGLIWFGTDWPHRKIGTIADVENLRRR
jgi:hypothetical protein